MAEEIVSATYTALNQYRKFETINPRKGIPWPHPSFHIHVSVSDLYIPIIDLPIFFSCMKYVD